MAQHDYSIQNGSGSAVRADLNVALAAIVSNNSGASEPSPSYAYQFWADTSTGFLKIRNSSNSGWVTLRELDGTLIIEAGTAATPGLYFAGDTNTGIYSPAADQFAISTGGVERVKWGTNEVVFNDGGVDCDFRIEGDTKQNLFSVDAGSDLVSIDGAISLTNRSPIFFGDADNSSYVGFRAPSVVASNFTWDLPATDGANADVLTTNGSGGLSFAARSRLAVGTAVAATSGTSLDFTGIPSWAKRITVILDSVSTTGTSPVTIYLGTSSGMETAGYTGLASAITGLNNCTVVPYSSGAVLPGASSSDQRSYSIAITNVTGNRWIVTGIGVGDLGGSPIQGLLTSIKTLAGVLDRIRVTTISGSDTFDGGLVNIMWEG